MMTIGDQSVPMFHDDVTHWIHLAMGSIGHPCRTIQGSVRHPSLMTIQALRKDLYVMRSGQVPRQYCSSFEGGIYLWSGCSSITLLDHNQIRQIVTFGLLGRQSVTLNIGLNIGCSHNRLSEQSAKCNIGQALPPGFLVVPCMHGTTAKSRNLLMLASLYLKLSFTELFSCSGTVCNPFYSLMIELTWVVCASESLNCTCIDV